MFAIVSTGYQDKGVIFSSLKGSIVSRCYSTNKFFIEHPTSLLPIGSMVSELVVNASGEAMTAILAKNDVVSSTDNFVEPTNLDTGRSTIPANAPSSRFKFVQFVSPKKWDEVQIPEGTKHLILGIPGFLCTSEALKPALETLNTTDTMYIDWGSVLNLGFTKTTTKYIVDYADYLAQTFGAPISVHGNSLGGFKAMLVGQKLSDLVERIYLTASPHQLTMNPLDLREHTNIAPFLGVMRSRLFGRFYDQEMMDIWEQYRHGAIDLIAGEIGDAFERISTATFSPIVEEVKASLEAIDMVSFAATDDSTVNGKKCLFDPAPNRRNFAVVGDHVDVIRGAIPVIQFLNGKPIDTPLPDDLSKTLLSEDAVTDLVRRTPGEVAIDFVVSSIPTEKVSTLLRGISNTPKNLMDRALGRRIDDLATDPNSPTKQPETPVLALARSA